MKVLKRGKEEGFASVIFYSILVAAILGKDHKSAYLSSNFYAKRLDH